VWGTLGSLSLFLYIYQMFGSRLKTVDGRLLNVFIFSFWFRRPAILLVDIRCSMFTTNLTPRTK